MAEADVENIVRSLSQILPAQLEQRRLNEEKLYRQQQVDLENRRFEAQNLANQKMFELQKSQVEAQQAQTELANTAAFQRTGINPPGYIVQPGLQPTPQQPLVLSGLQNATLIPPSGRVYSVPPLAETPEQQLVRQQAQAAEAAEIRKSQATQQAETARQVQVAQVTQAEETKRFLAQIHEQKEYDLERARIDTRGRQAIANMESAERLRAAMITATGGLSEMAGGNLFGQPKGIGQGGVSITAGDGQPQVNIPGPLGSTINQSLTNIYKGIDSLERQEKVNPKLKQPISSAASYYGVGSLTDADVKELHDLQLMSEAAPILQQLHQLKRDSPYAINMPGTDAFSQFNAKANELDTLIPRIATSSSGSKRMSEPELKRYFEGYIPNRMPPPIAKASAENEKYNKFVTQDLWNRAKTIVQGLPQNQQSAILSQYGFTRLPSTIVTRPSNIGQVPGSVVRWIRDPKTNQLVQVPQ